MLKPTLSALMLALMATAAAPAMASESHDQVLQAALDGMAAKAAPARFGILVTELDTGVTAKVNDGHAYMMMSAFKAPVAAAVLHLVDEGKLSLDQKVHLTPDDVVPGSAVPSIGARVATAPADITLAELLAGAVSQSDNTAVDALIRLAGGGPVMTHWLHDKGVQGMRIDVGEREVSAVFEGLPAGQKPPAGETAAQEAARLRKGYEAAIRMTENTSTLEGAASFLTRLQAGQLLSAASTRRLLDMMQAQVIPTRIRAGLEHGFVIADKTGTGASNGKRIAAWNDMAIITAPNGKRAVVVAFLRDTTATDEQRAAWFRDLGALVASDLLAP